MNAKERCPGVNFVRRCFPEGGDSVLSIFSRDPKSLRAKLQTTNEFLWLAE